MKLISQYSMTEDFCYYWDPVGNCCYAYGLQASHWKTCSQYLGALL